MEVQIEGSLGTKMQKEKILKSNNDNTKINLILVFGDRQKQIGRKEERR